MVKLVILFTFFCYLPNSDYQVHPLTGNIADVVREVPIYSNTSCDITAPSGKIRITFFLN